MACDSAVVLAIAVATHGKHLEDEGRTHPNGGGFDWDCKQVKASATEGAHIDMSTWSDSWRDLIVGGFRAISGLVEPETVV